MKRKLNILAGDTALWVIFFLMSTISLIAVYSTIGLSAISDLHTTPMAIFFKHLRIVVVTYIAIIVISHIDYRVFSKLIRIVFLLSLAMLILVIVMGTERWLVIPKVGRFQPSEIAKIALVIYLARKISVNRDSLDDSRTFCLLLFPVVVVCLLVGPKNLSTAILIFLTCYLMLLFGGVDKRLWWKGFAAIVCFGLVAFAVLYAVGDKVDVARSGTWGHRLQNWMHPNYDDLTQENMARMAIARGFPFGCGIGQTIHGRLMTQAHNDFIYAIIIEETGLVAAFAVFSLYAMFYFRCIRIATRCPGRFGSLSVAGIGTLVLLQAMANMSVAAGVLPVTGQTLPFISYGGTAYFFMGCGIGVIQAVAADNKKRARLQARAAAEAAAAESPEAPEAVAGSNNETIKIDNK